MTVLAAANAFLLALVSLWGWCFTGTGQIALLVPIMLIGSALNVALSVAGAYAIGIAGPLLGTGIAIAATTLWYLPAQLHRRFGTPLGGLARAVLAPIAWATLPAAAIWWLSRTAPPASWPALAAEAAAAAVLMIGVWWFGELKSAERAHYLERVRMVLPRRAG